jgi:hypothetical protein
MNFTAIPGRPVYEPSGRARWDRLLLAAHGVLGVIIVVAVGMNWCYQVGLGFVPLPFAAAMPVAFVVYEAIGWGHCRSKLIASVFGLVAGVGFIVAQYYFDMVTTLGPESALRVDMLPPFVKHRMSTNRMTFSDGPSPPQKPGSNSDRAFNWMLFVAELGLVPLGMIAAADFRARYTYCEKHGCWMVPTSIQCAAGTGKRLVAALKEGKLGSVVEELALVDGRHQAFCEVKFEHCPISREPTWTSPVYLTLTEFDTPANKRFPNRLAHEWCLTDDETAKFQTRIVALASSCEKPP